jgi:hypothetical protein
LRKKKDKFVQNWVALHQHFRTRSLKIYLENVEKRRQRRSLPARSASAKAGRNFAVLTYSMYAPRVKMAAAFPSA